MKKWFWLVLFFVIYACGNPGHKKSSSHDGDKEVGEQKIKLKTSTGKSFWVVERKKTAGLSDLLIVPKGFEHTRDTFKLKETDPLKNTFVADLNHDGFDEVYLVTISAGSGSYSSIYGFASNRDKSVTPVYVQEMGALGIGYQGHDSIYVTGQMLARSFPVYLQDDPNCCPSGGRKTVFYTLKAGEAGWILEPDSMFVDK